MQGRVVLNSMSRELRIRRQVSGATQIVQEAKGDR
jgi:hypothetical protein